MQIDEIDILFSAYVDDESAPEQLARLSSELRASQKIVDRFVRHSYLHWQLFELARQSSLRADALEGEHESLADLSTTSRDWPSRPGAAKGSKRRWSAHAMQALAAGLLLAIVAAWWGARPWGGPPIVAQVSQTTPNILAPQSERKPAAGDLLHRGQVLRVQKGRLLTTLISGAQVIVEGPATLTLTDRNEVRFDQGRMTAYVPRQATGFAVETPQGRLVDLGTEFTLECTAPQKCSIHVFRGLVDFQPLRRAGASAVPMHVPAGRAVSYDAVTGDVQVLPYEESQKMSLAEHQPR